MLLCWVGDQNGKKERSVGRTTMERERESTSERWKDCQIKEFTLHSRLRLRGMSNNFCHVRSVCCTTSTVLEQSYWSTQDREVIERILVQQIKAGRSRLFPRTSLFWQGNPPWRKESNFQGERQAMETTASPLSSSSSS